MDALAAADISLFEGFRLDRRGGVLFRRDQQGAFTPIAIGRRALDILGVLVERPGDLVPRNEIIEAVWPGTTVEDSNLNVQIAALRRILDNGRAEGSCIQTVSGRGYRFVGPVTRVEPGASPSSDGVAPIAEDGQSRGPSTGIAAYIAAAPRYSIVVLPFTNLSDDREQQYFADGITEDLTTDLSRLADMLVISRSTAITYQGKPVGTKQIGRELCVRYVLEGSVRRSGDQVRVNAQLIDAETNVHLWAERFDRDTGDLFALQDEITSRIAVALNLELVGAEAARPTEHPDALDYILRGRAANFRPPARDKHAEAISLFERALALDPRSVEALSLLATALTARVLDHMTDSRAADVARAEDLSLQALAASPRSPLAHYAKGNVLRAQHQYEEALPEYETAIAFNRNWVSAIHALGHCKFNTGSIEETIPLEEQAIRLSPRDPFIGNWYHRIGMVHLLQSRTDEAILWLEKARSANPAHPQHHAVLASAYALKGETERATTELAAARRLSSDDRYSSIARLKAVGYFGAPKIRALHETTYFAGLRKAGMLEEWPPLDSRHRAESTPQFFHSADEENCNLFTGRKILTLPGAVVRAPPGLQGFDANTVLTSSLAQQLHNAGFAFCLRYLSRAARQPASDLTIAEARRILSAKLALMPVQHVSPEGWVPTAELGATNGSHAAQHALDIGFPPGVNVWLDLEGIAPSVSSEVVIDYCNAWFTEVDAVGFVSGVYVGANAILSGEELYWRLKTKHYWHSLSRVPDIPHRGYQMFQSAVKHPLAGVDIDRNVTMNDAFGDSVLWLAPP